MADSPQYEAHDQIRSPQAIENEALHATMREHLKERARTKQLSKINHDLKSTAEKTARLRVPAGGMRVVGGEIIEAQPGFGDGAKATVDGDTSLQLVALCVNGQAGHMLVNGTAPVVD